MDSVIDIESARALVADGALWPRVRDFLWDFAPCVHPTRLAAIGMDKAPVQSSRVRRYILDVLGVKPFFHDFPAEDLSRLALLDGATLENLVKWMGALACAPSLRMVMDGARVRALKSSFAGVYPEVFSFTAYFPGAALDDVKDAASLAPDDVAAAGFSLLLAYMEGAPRAVVERMLLKLPLGFQADKQRPSPPRARLVKLLKLKFPEAYALCC